MCQMQLSLSTLGLCVFSFKKGTVVCVNYMRPTDLSRGLNSRAKDF